MATEHREILHGVAASGAIASSLEAAPLAVVVDLVRTGRARTRPELTAVSGLSRKVVTQRVDQACEIGLLREGGLAPSGGGRHARVLEFDPDAGRVFGVLIGASELRVAVAALDGRPLATSQEDWTVDSGPEATMQRVHAHIDALAVRHAATRPWGIGVGVPGPVDFPEGRLIAPPIMPGWDGFSVRAWLRERVDAPVWVDNDVNLMAVGEWVHGVGPRTEDMLFLKVGTGIGSAVISRGRLLRGQRGAAGDIGHIRVSDDPTAVCRCGEVGCLEAVAGGWSLIVEATQRASESPTLLDALRERGRISLGDVGAASRAGDPVAREMLGERAAALGEVTASLVNFANPGQLVVGGGVLRAGEELVGRIEDVVRRRSTKIASEHLVVRPASLDQQEGVTGAALLAVENLLSPIALARWVEDASPLGHAAALQRFAPAFA
ncbi:ROK family protein [Microbacterium aurantiacum]|uniref:ROK family protein n=1 Tax=Microbacterium aurantiacum TaxID=162393 RepID=A0AAJ2HHT8_9MICO|nr:ROK family protein [Microbacterium aurantiacum]MDS0245054.1 ROK family protein [Microbacterium aurantiacum]